MIVTFLAINSGGTALAKGIKKKEVPNVRRNTASKRGSFNGDLSSRRLRHPHTSQVEVVSVSPTMAQVL
jgi:hypothetical protein